MTTTMVRTKVVDCDTHFNQPLALWQPYIEDRHRDAITQFVAGLRTKNSSNLREKMGLAEYEAIKGGDDPLERLKWMDGEGIDTNVIYPGQSVVSMMDDPHAASAACRALNRWAANFASAAPARLKPCMILPMRWPDHALRELEFARGLGLNILFIPPTLPIERHWGDPALDPVYRELQDKNVVVTFHEFSQVPKGAGHQISRESYKDSYPFMYFCGHVVEVQLALMNVIGGGVLERFPRLRVGFVEANIAWLPGWLALMDNLWGWLSNHKRQPKGTKAMSLTATEFFRRQCYIVAFPDDAWVPQCIEHVGEDNVVLCTDYPHPGTTYRMKDTFAQTYPGLSEGTRRKLLGANAERILDLR